MLSSVRWDHIVGALAGGILSGKRRARRNRIAVVEYEDVKFWTCQHIICWMEGFLIQGAGASSPAVALRPCEFSAAT